MLTFEDYKSQLKELPFGKKLPEAVYLVREEFYKLDLPIVGTVKILFEKVVKDDTYNIIKLFFKDFKISFLSYPDFWEIAHPPLRSSLSIHLATGAMKRFDYHKSKNPPILHRKEEFIPSTHPMHCTFSALTRSEENIGLFENKTVIGFKENWEFILCQKGVEIIEHSLSIVKPSEQSSSHDVHRHKTAISRFGFSKPVQTLLENSILSKTTTLFDYGCGLGDDISGLQSLDFSCWGWDPNHRKEGKKEKADIVNLGFVLNVIEDPIERVAVLKEAYDYANKVLVVSCMLTNANSSSAFQSFGDGVLTSRNTFQKYFDQDELQHYIQDALEIPEAIAAAPGVFYVFKDPIEKQSFLARKSKRVINWDQLSTKVFANKERRTKQTLLDRFPEELDHFFAVLVELGRLPLESEFKELERFKSEICSPKRALNLFVSKFGNEVLEQSAQIRRDDLLVYLALSNFQVKVPFKDLSPELRLDIKSFLGGFQKGHKAALELLFQIADEFLIEELCDATDVGFLDEQALYVRTDQLQDLHVILRIYVGCAERLVGDLGSMDIIKIHKLSGKVTFLQYDNFEDKILPELQLRIKVNLPLRKIQYFDYSNYHVKQLLFHKVRFYSETDEGYSKLLRHSRKLREIGISEEGYGPNKLAFENMLLELNLTTNLYQKRS